MSSNEMTCIFSMLIQPSESNKNEFCIGIFYTLLFKAINKPDNQLAININIASLKERSDREDQRCFKLKIDLLAAVYKKERGNTTDYVPNCNQTYYVQTNCKRAMPNGFIVVFFLDHFNVVKATGKDHGLQF